MPHYPRHKTLAKFDRPEQIAAIADACEKYIAEESAWRDTMWEAHIRSEMERPVEEPGLFAFLKKQGKPPAKTREEAIENLKKPREREDSYFGMKYPVDSIYDHTFNRQDPSEANVVKLLMLCKAKPRTLIVTNDDFLQIAPHFKFEVSE